MTLTGDNHFAETTEGMRVTTKPCWICGQSSEVLMPHDSWIKWECKELHIDLAWPEGSAEDKQLIRTGIHPKCWDEEFPPAKAEIDG